MDIILLKCDEVLCIQVIPLKRTGSSNEAKAMKLVEANIGNLAKAYEKIIKLRWFSPKTFHFFSKESSWEIKSVDEEDREKDLPAGAFKTIVARPLVPREKFQGSDEEYQKEVENFETLKKLKTDYANDSVKAAIKKSVKGKNFMETLLLTEMSSHDEDTKFLLVYGKSLSGEFSTDEIRRVRNKETGKLEIGPVCLLNVQDSHLKVGQIDFRADFLADHIIYGLRVDDDSSSSYELSNPQFQLVDINLNPISSLTEETESTKKKKPTPHITIEGVTSSSIKTLQIIGVDNHVRNLLLQNAGHVEDAYPEIVKHATEKKSMTDKIRFFSDESDIVAKNYRLQKKPDSKVKTEIIKDIHNLDKKEEKRLQEMGFWGDEINSALHRIFIGCKNFVWEAVRRLLKYPGKLWPYEHYLLVVGESISKCSASGSGQYEIPNEDEKGKYDCLQFIGVNENVEIGSLKFKLGILADHIIFNGSINHPNDKEATDSNDKVLSNPQFQLCDCLLNPVDMPEPNSNSLGTKASNSEEQNGSASGSGHKTVSINIEGTASSSIKYLQVIEINKHIEEILKKSAGRVKKAYPEIAKYARNGDNMFSLRFFSNEEERVATVYGHDGEEGSEVIAGRSKVMYLQDLDAYGIKRPMAQLMKTFFDPSWVKGTVFGFNNLVAANINSWLVSELKRMEDEKVGMPDSSRRPFSFYTRMIRSAVTKYGKGNRYLLVVGEGHDEYTTSGSSRYEIGIVDDEREYDSHEYIGINEDVAIGSLKFHVDSIADHVFYHGKLYGPHSDDGEYSDVTTVNNPQFQFVNKDFEPIDNPYTEK